MMSVSRGPFALGNRDSYGNEPFYMKYAKSSFSELPKFQMKELRVEEVFY